MPSIGLCDGMRVGPDVAGHWSSYRDDVLLKNPTVPGVQNAIRTTLNRLWLKPLLQTDPDVTFFRSKMVNLTANQKSLLQDLASIAEFKATSDVPSWLTGTEKESLRKFLEEKPVIQRLSNSRFVLDGQPVDFTSSTAMPELPGWSADILGAIIGRLANVPFLMKIFDRFGQRDLARKLRKNPV